MILDLIRVVVKDEKRKPITVKGLLDNGGGSVFAFHPQTMMMIIVHSVRFVQNSFQLNLIMYIAPISQQL